MWIVVSKWISPATNLNATLVSGGNLEANTTYYYTIVCYSDERITPIIWKQSKFSDLSTEWTFTTTTTELSAHITRTNPPEHTSLSRYDIFLTKISWNYEWVKWYNFNPYDKLWTKITSWVTWYTITWLWTDNYMIHTAQSTNSFAWDIDKKLWEIVVNIDWWYYYDYWKKLYDKIVSQWYWDYVRWENNTLIIKWWIITTGSTAWLISFLKTNFIFIRWWIYGWNPNFIIRFWLWTDDYIWANYERWCCLDYIWARNPFTTPYDNVLQFYWWMITSANSRKTDNPELLLIDYWLSWANFTLWDNVSWFKDSIFGVVWFRQYSSDISDLKWLFSNNFWNYNHYRVDIAKRATFPYSDWKWSFYRCNFLDSGYNASYQPWSWLTYYSDLYDCMFPRWTNNKWLPHRWFIYAPMTVATWYIRYNYSVKIICSNEDWTPIEWVNIHWEDKDWNPAERIEFDTTLNRQATWNKYTTDRTTDSNWKIEYYLLSYQANHDPNDPWSWVSNDTKYWTIITDKYPYTITITKKWYESQQIKLETLLYETTLSVTLKKAVPLMIDSNGEAHIRFNKENIGNNRELIW